MKYFLHDCNSFDDEKISELFMKFGYEGLGLFYTTLEKIGKQEKPVKTTVLKAQLKVGKRLEKCWSFMEEIGIINTLNGETFNENILKFSETYAIKKEKTRKKVSEWRNNQQVTKNVTSYVPECNQPKVNISKVNKEKEKEKSFPVMPKMEDVGELPKVKIESAIEQIAITTQQNVSEKQIILFWEAWKKQKLTGEKYYAGLHDVYSHFINCAKKEKFSNQIRAPERQATPLRTASDYLK